MDKEFVISLLSRALAKGIDIIETQNIYAFAGKAACRFQNQSPYVRYPIRRCLIAQGIRHGLLDILPKSGDLKRAVQAVLLPVRIR